MKNFKQFVEAEVDKPERRKTVLSLRPKADRMYNPKDDFEKKWKGNDKTTPSWFVPKDFSDYIDKKSSTAGAPKVSNSSKIKAWNKYVDKYNPGNSPRATGKVIKPKTRSNMPVLKTLDKPDKIKDYAPKPHLDFNKLSPQQRVSPKNWSYQPKIEI
jgi:hypothetical protein